MIVILLLFASMLIPTLALAFLIMLAIPNYRRSEAFKFVSGMVEVGGINLLLITVIFLLMTVGASKYAQMVIYGFVGIGLVQLLYVVPRSLFLKRRQQWSRLKGVIAGAVIVALINGSCWLMMTHVQY